MADSKLADLTATTALSAGDLVYVVRDPSGTPVDRKMDVDNLADALVALNGWRTVKRKSADESVTSSTTLQDDDELFFAVTASSIWVANFYLAHEAATAGDIKYEVTVPSGATGFIQIIGMDPTTVASIRALASTAPIGGLAIGGLGAGTLGCSLVSVSVSVSATPGDVKLQFAQQSSSGTATTIKAGSFLVAHRIS